VCAHKLVLIDDCRVTSPIQLKNLGVRVKSLAVAPPQFGMFHDSFNSLGQEHRVSPVK